MSGPNKYKAYKDLAESLRALSKKHNVTFITATQPQSETKHFIQMSTSNKVGSIMIDHTSLIN